MFLQITVSGQGNQKLSVYDLPTPLTIWETFKILDRTLSEKEISLIRSLPEDSIYFHPLFIHGTDFFHAWKIYDGSILTNYFNMLGLYGSFEIYETILISYHRYLNKKSIDLKKQIAKYQKAQKADYQVYSKRIVADTLDGVYIPENLQDCFTELDKALSDEDKAAMKSLKDREEMITSNHRLGMAIRNSWGLLRGSRLEKYLLSKGLKEPDEMSATILKFYYDWLNQNHEGWKEWAK